MNVYLSTLGSPTLLALASRFRERGNSVSHSDQVPLDGDLYLFCAGQETMKNLTRGLVVLDLRDDSYLEAAAWTPYADLCLVRDAATQTTLAETHGCEPERVFLVPDDGTLLDMLDKALRDELPPARVEKRGEILTKPQEAPDRVPLSSRERLIALGARLQAMDRKADVMLHDYQVRSKLPLVGPLVAWVRRNLTSHLREPYLDPTLERQVAMNRDLVAALREMVRLHADLEAHLVRLEEEQEHD